MDGRSLKPTWHPHLECAGKQTHLNGDTMSPSARGAVTEKSRLLATKGREGVSWNGAVFFSNEESFAKTGASDERSAHSK